MTDTSKEALRADLTASLQRELMQMQRADEAEALLHEFQAAQGYRYIGRDMKPVLARDLEDLIEALTAERDAMKAKLAEAVEEKLDAISTLDAWFDRRKLAHDAVDQFVIDAVSGYLRTARVGGMPQKDSDLVLAVIQDMARLSLFADLFARAALKEIKGENND